MASGTGTLQNVREGESFDLGDCHLEVRKLPGHTKGSAGLYYQEREWLFMGDAYGMGVLFAPKDGAKLSVFKEGLEKTVALSPRVIWGGHGPEALDPKVLERMLSCCNQLKIEEAQSFDYPLAPGAKLLRWAFGQGKDEISFVMGEENL